MKEIAVFGGSFNPPTLAHAAIIRECLARDDMDEVWVMPSGDRFDKQYDGNDLDRLNMVRLMLDEVFPDQDRLKLCEVEMDMPRPTQTWRTVKEMERQHPNNNFWYVYGTDSYHHMPDWQEGGKLQKELNLLLVGRDGDEVPAGPNIRELNAHNELDGRSSTLAREHVAAGLPLNGWVCRSVANYIAWHGLYRPSDIEQIS